MIPRLSGILWCMDAQKGRNYLVLKEQQTSKKRKKKKGNKKRLRCCAEKRNDYFFWLHFLCVYFCFFIFFSSSILLSFSSPLFPSLLSHCHRFYVVKRNMLLFYWQNKCFYIYNDIIPWRLSSSKEYNRNANDIWQKIKIEHEEFVFVKIKMGWEWHEMENWWIYVLWAFVVCIVHAYVYLFVVPIFLLTFKFLVFVCLASSSRTW